MWPALQAFRLRDAIDILLVSLVLYRVFVMFKETRAVQMLLGLGALMAASFLARRFELYGTSWILDNFWSFWVLALIVLFQPELRRALAQVGQNPFFRVVTRAGREQQSHLLNEVVKAALSLAGKRIGGLVVLERATGLRNYVELGVPLDALVSADLLESIFLPYSPLHDGAVFIRGGRLPSALPQRAARARDGHPPPRGARAQRGDRRRRAGGLGGERTHLAGSRGPHGEPAGLRCTPPAPGRVLLSRGRSAAGRPALVGAGPRMAPQMIGHGTSHTGDHMINAVGGSGGGAAPLPPEPK